MTDGLIELRSRMTRKAIRFFQENPNVSYEQFLDFVNYKMGTDIHEDYLSDWYKYFMEKREEKDSAPQVG